MEKFEKIILIELSDETVKTVLHITKELNTEGLVQRCDDYYYLKVDDAYIHLIQPLLDKYGDITKPTYFNPPNNIGAHISIIYPKEEKKIPQIISGQKHTFSVCGLFKAQYGIHEYFALSVISPSLEAFRRKHGLTARPSFKRQEVPFHITVGVKLCTNTQRRYAREINNARTSKRYV